jgi:hypothetical protein
MVALLLVIPLAPGSDGFTRDLELTGTLDCGVASGARCVIGDTVAIWTTDVDGRRRLVSIDVSWVRTHLSGLDQDDLVSFEVRDLGDGRFQAVAFHAGTSQAGTVVGGSSTGSYAASHSGSKDPDEDDPPVEALQAGLSPTSTPTSTPRPAPTSTASPTSTSTPAATTTATATATATSTSTSTATPTATLTPTPTPTSTATPTSTPVPPTISIADAVLLPDADTQDFARFAVTLDKVWTQTVTVNFATQDGTYLSTTGYFPLSTDVTFEPGATLQFVDVAIRATNCTGSPKNFFGNLSSPINATILDPQGEALLPVGAC